MPVQVEDRLARAGARVDDDTVIGQARVCSDLRNEVEQPLVLVGRIRSDFLEAVDVLLGNDEQVRLRLRVDVADGDDAVRRGDVVAVAEQRAEETVVAHAANTPSSVTRPPRTSTNSPTSPSTSHG